MKTEMEKISGEATNQHDSSKNEMLAGLFLGGKSPKELGFPHDWIYEPDMRRWRSEKKSIEMEDLRYKTTEKVYLYITDEMLYRTLTKKQEKT